MNSEVYIKALLNHQIPWIEKVADGYPRVFQQDGARAHTAGGTIPFLDKVVMKYVPPETWPPNSPNLNPLDFFGWGEVERRSNEERHVFTLSLKGAIIKAFTDLDCETCVTVCSSVRGHVQQVIAGKGSYID